eukprot:scaffold99755_cov62-Attheya_sp.AAC.2
MGWRRAPNKVRSKSHSPEACSLTRAAADSGGRSGCINTQPMPSADQSVFKKHGRGDFELIEQGKQRRGPCLQGDGKTVVALLKGSEGLDPDLKPWAIFMIKVGEIDERMEGRAIVRLNPVSDQVKFGLSRSVTVGCHIVTDVFDTGFEKVAFGQAEGDAIFLEHFAHAFE